MAKGSSQLVEWAKDRECEHLLDVVIMRPMLELLNRADRRALDRSLRGARSTTLRKLADVAERDPQIFLACTRLIEILSVHAPVAEVAAPKAPVVDWTAWAKTNFVQDVLAAPVSEYAAPEELAKILPRGGRVPTVGAILMGTKDFSPALREGVETVVRRVAANRAEALAQERAAAPKRAVAPTLPVLASWWSALHAVRTHLRPMVPTPLLIRDPFVLRVDPAKGRLLVRGGAFAAGSEFPVPLTEWEDGSPIEGLWKWPAEYRLAVLDMLLDLITGVSHAEVLAEIVLHLRFGRWREELGLLDKLLAPRASQRTADEVLGWRVRGDSAEGMLIEPVWVRTTKSGAVATRAVQVMEEAIDAARSEDEVVAIERVMGGLRDYRDVVSVVDALVGHPQVYREVRGGAPVRVVRAVATLTIDRVGDDVQLLVRANGADMTEAIQRPLRMADGVFHGALRSTTVVSWQEPDTLLVVRVSARLRELVLRMRRNGVVVPAEAAGQLLERLPLLESAAPVVIAPEFLGEPVAPDERVIARLTGAPGSLEVALCLRPLPEHAPVTPGAGAGQLHTVRNGVRAYVERDLDREQRLADAVRSAFGLPGPGADHGWRWQLQDASASLAVLRALRDDPTLAVVEWSGAPVRLGARVKAKDVRLRLGASRDWFQLEGGATVGGHQIDLSALLEAAQEGRGWVRIKDGSWVDLEDTLHELLGVAASLRQGQKRQVQMRSTHTPVLTALASQGVAVDAPPEWWSFADRIDEARTLETPIPPGLCAELRPYQHDGFRWLAALAHWAPGAVLADDMGLGKTVQAIALLLHRAALGPAVVVAPTSVVDNWAAEIAKFGPSLRAIVIRGANRQERMTDVGPSDVLLVSYDVLVRDQAAFTAISPATLVVDEAHQIKNHTTQRARAVHDLPARFVLALSGTPVENHLLDLWSLFRAVSPGLLGSVEAFRTGLAAQIQEARDPAARAALARLVRPFILRRKKSEVELQLPARTEIVLTVDLSVEERALYDRERLTSLVSLEGPAEGRRFQILAALTRLRQLACHPRLHDPTSPIPSSKLQRARELIGALREDGHQVLVFSQFSTHLKLVRDALIEDGLRLRYLDGSTPAEQRKEEVAAFQRGEADAFLISLKAGGTGLNLTAATYVVHLDPWWNPAAEDQATDRAHRIGQTRPVTVYRLVTRGTIEEQVIKLHGEKRELAAAVLDGTDTAHRASAAELLSLLAGAEEPEAAPPEHVDVLAPRAIAAADPREIVVEAEEVEAAPAVEAPPSRKRASKGAAGRASASAEASSGAGPAAGSASTTATDGAVKASAPSAASGPASPSASGAASQASAPSASGAAAKASASSASGAAASAPAASASGARSKAPRAGAAPGAVPDPPAASPSTRTIAEAVAGWSEAALAAAEVGSPSHGTTRTYIGALRKLVAFGGPRPFSELPSTAEAWFDALAASGQSPSSVTVARAALRRMTRELGVG